MGPARSLLLLLITGKLFCSAMLSSSMCYIVSDTSTGASRDNKMESSTMCFVTRCKADRYTRIISQLNHFLSHVSKVIFTVSAVIIWELGHEYLWEASSNTTLQHTHKKSLCNY